MRHLRATRARARQCRTSELAQWRTEDTLRTRIKRESSRVHAMVRSNKSGAPRALSHSKFTENDLPLSGERPISEHDTLRRPNVRSDIVGVIVQIQTVSHKEKKYPTLDLESFYRRGQRNEFAIREYARYSRSVSSESMLCVYRMLKKRNDLKTPRAPTA